MPGFATSDRFIPTNLAIQVYRHSDSRYDFKKINIRPNQLPVLSLLDDFMFRNLYEQNKNQRMQLVSTQTTEPATDISNALDIKINSHVLSYKQQENEQPLINLFSISDPIISNKNSRDISRLYANTPIIPPTKEPIKTIIEKSCLKAPNLRDDFYSNLISWSCSGPRVSMALGLHAFTWGINTDITRIRDASPKEMITCTSFSPKNDWLLIGTSIGKLLLILNHKIISVVRVFNCSIYCISWFKNGNMFLLGDEVGDIYVFEIINVELVMFHKFKSQKQQVCSIAINNDEDEITVGGNDNCCNVWDLTNLKDPKFRFKLKHSAAVKGLAYCPWSKSLLATGGGSRDRNLRFWHSKSGTLLRRVYTNSQITSIVWSKFQKEVAITFGFGGNDKVLVVYAYPSMVPRIEVPCTTGLRFLSSAESPDGTSIAVATNDATIRVYKLWQKTLSIVANPEFLGCGTIGSAIIEHSEGIEGKVESIR